MNGVDENVIETLSPTFTGLRSLVFVLFSTPSLWTTAGDVFLCIGSIPDYE
jgi:hypothetical protein